MEEMALIIDIACRFHRVIESHGLEPAHTPDELVARIAASHYADPLDLQALLHANEVDLVVKVSEMTRAHANDVLRVQNSVQAWTNLG